MPHDALDPGPLSDYPHWPRRPDGTPDPARMPTGEHRQPDRSRGGQRVKIDVTPRTPEGQPITPPTLPPGSGS